MIWYFLILREGNSISWDLTMTMLYGDDNMNELSLLFLLLQKREAFYFRFHFLYLSSFGDLLTVCPLSSDVHQLLLELVCVLNRQRLQHVFLVLVQRVEVRFLLLKSHQFQLKSNLWQLKNIERNGCNIE